MSFSRGEHLLSSKHGYTNAHCLGTANWFIVSFKCNMRFNFLALFIFELYLVSPCISAHCKVPICFFSGALLHFHSELLSLCGLWKQALFALRGTSFCTIICHIPLLNPPKSCFGGLSRLTSSTCFVSCQLDIWCFFCFHFIALFFYLLNCLQLFICISCKGIFLKTGHPIHSSTCTVDLLTTIYTNNWVILCPEAADHVWVIITFR